MTALFRESDFLLGLLKFCCFRINHCLEWLFTNESGIYFDTIMFVCVFPLNLHCVTCNQTDFEIEVTDKDRMYSPISFGNFKPVLL